jgi:hypothetical protein
MPEGGKGIGAETVITFERRKGEDAAEFILGDDGLLGVGTSWGNEGFVYWLNKDEARDVAQQILNWATT